MTKRHFLAGKIADETPRRWCLMVKPEDTHRLVALLNQEGYKNKLHYPRGDHDMHTVTGTNALQMRPLFDTYDFIFACEWLDVPTRLV